MPSPMSWLAHSAARSSARSGATVATTRRTRTCVTNWRIILAAVSWLATLRMSAASGPPAGGVPDRTGSVPTMRAPSCSGSPGHHLGDAARQGRPGGPTQAVNSASLPPNQWLTIAGSTPARSAITPHGGALVAALGELGAGGGEQGRPGVRPPPGRRRPRRRRVGLAVTASILAPGRGRARCTRRRHERRARAGTAACRGRRPRPSRRHQLRPRRRRRRHPRWAPSPPAATSSASWPRGHRVIPVARRLLADDETPGRRLPQARRRPARARSCSSRRRTAGRGRAGRSSAPGSAAALTAVDGELVWTGEVPAGLPASAATRSPRCAPSSRSCTASRCRACRR